MIGLMKPERSPVGIDIGSRCVKAVQLERSKSGWRIAAAAAFAHAGDDVPSPDAVANRIAEVMGRQGFTGRSIVLAVPAAQLILNTLELPPRASGAPLEEIARAELARAAKVGPDALEARLWDLPDPARAANATHCMAAAVRHADADALLDVLERHALRVRALDIQAWALCRACLPLTRESAGLSCILDLGWTSAMLTLVQRQTVLYQRTLGESGLLTLRTAIASRFDVMPEVAGHLLEASMADDPERRPSRHANLNQDLSAVLASHLDAMVEELRVSLTYASHRYPAAPVLQLLLTGGGAGLADLPEKIERATGIPARRVNPSELMECNPAVQARCQRPLLMTAMGLAQHAGD